jgi:drug/metabolite transporter (DMT)-like permease
MEVILGLIPFVLRLQSYASQDKTIMHFHRINPKNFGLDRNTLLGLSAILLWSSTVALARSISEQLGPLTAGSSVYLTAGLFLTGYGFLKERSFKTLRTLPRKYVYGCGVLFLIYTTSLFLALGFAENRGQTIEVGLLNYLWPAFTILFSLPILGNKATLWLIPGTLLALFGVFLVLTHETAVSWSSLSTNLSTNPIAYGLGFLAAVSWGLYSNLARRWGDPNSSGAVQLFTLCTGITFWLISLLWPETGVWSVRTLIEVAFLGLATALAYVFWDMSMRAGDMVLVAASSYLTPLFSTIVSCIYLGVRPGLGLWLGCAIIIAGSFLSWLSIRPADVEKLPAEISQEIA